MDALLERPAARDEVSRVSTDEVPGLLSRPRLLERMRQGADARLIVVRAPAGFGKSVLVGQWAGQHVGSPLAWLTLRAEDEAPAVATRLLAAVRSLGADVRPAAPGWVPESAAGLGKRFTDELVGRLEPVGDAVLVLDGLDAPRIRALTSELGLLADRAPRGLRVVATRRSRWHAPLHSGRNHGEPVGLDEADLAFTPEEVTRLVRQLAGRELTDRQLDALVERTGGWPVGLHVAAMAMRDADPDQVVDGLCGNERCIAAFLREEVLDRQPPSLRRFLVRSSVLDTVNAPLCAAVTGERRAGMALRVLEHRGAFLRRVDREGKAFVHHSLFRDMLRRELRVSEPDEEADLLARAAGWYVDHDEPERAASCLIEAEDWDGLLGLVDRYGGSLFESGAANEMLGWLDAIPVCTGRRDQVAVRRAYVLTMLGRTRLAEQVLRDLKASESSPGERVVIDALRSTWAFIDASPSSAVEAADDALTALNHLDGAEVPCILGMTSPANLRTMAAGSRAHALWLLGDVTGSREALSALAREPGVYEPWRTHVLSSLALLEAWAGNLSIAQRYAHHALAIAARAGLVDHPATLDAHLALAHALRERGDVLRALDRLDRAHRIAARMCRPVSLAIHTIEQVLWYFATRQPERGLRWLDAYSRMGDAAPPPIVERRLRAVEARLLLVLRGPDQADLVVRGAAAEPLPPELAAVGVQTALARRDVATAHALLVHWQVGDVDPRSRLEHELWTAIVDFESGRRRQALQRAAGMVDAAQAEGHLRLFLDAGRPAERLLRALVTVAPTAYARHLVRSAASSGATTGQQGVALSQRELEVVRYLPTSLSSAQIASQLFISLNTLKTHLRTIYRKLDVGDRREAIARLGAMGLA